MARDKLVSLQGSLSKLLFGLLKISHRPFSWKLDLLLSCSLVSFTLLIWAFCTAVSFHILRDLLLSVFFVVRSFKSYEECCHFSVPSPGGRSDSITFKSLFHKWFYSFRIVLPTSQICEIMVVTECLLILIIPFGFKNNLPRLWVVFRKLVSRNCCCLLSVPVLCHRRYVFPKRILYASGNKGSVTSVSRDVSWCFRFHRWTQHFFRHLIINLNHKPLIYFDSL